MLKLTFSLIFLKFGTSNLKRNTYFSLIKRIMRTNFTKNLSLKIYEKSYQSMQEVT